MDTMCDGRECWLCNEKAAVSCGSCGEFWYCTREHQRMHWKEHFAECKNFKVETLPGRGKAMIASRYVKEGVLILSDAPIAVAPLLYSDLQCLACHAPLYDDFFRCPDCAWPMCSLDCASAKAHDKECRFLSRDSKRCAVPQGPGYTPRYDLIMVLRCLLVRDSDPKMWALLLTMASHERELREKSDPYQTAAVRFLKEVCELDYDEEIIRFVRGVILANAIEIRGPYGSMLRALYPNIRLFNHSCLPNIHLSTTLENKMEARAAVPISKGEEMFISYTGTDAPFWERQKCLSESHYFTCSCRRCSDPTELGTLFSSSKCLFCLRKDMTPFVRDGCIFWICSKCSTESPLEEIALEFDEWLFRLEANELFGTGTPLKISYGLALVEQHFHVKHFIWLRAGQVALRKLKDNNSFEAFKLKKYIWEKILDIFDALEPGLTRKRGMTLHQVASTTLQMADPEFLERGVTSKCQVEMYLREARQSFMEAYKILRTTEPPGTTEHTLAMSIPATVSSFEQSGKGMESGEEGSTRKLLDQNKNGLANSQMVG